VREEKSNFNTCERGISVKSHNPEDFFEGLMYLSKNKNLQNGLSENGKNYVWKNYSKMRLIKDIEMLYENLTKS
jgi:glycosyltransferase involved in cell wall biosynthesis